MEHITYPIVKLREFQPKYHYVLAIEESTGFCARVEKNGRYHFVSGADLGVNSSASQRISADKSFTDFYLSRDGINTIPTAILYSASEIADLRLAFPLILKPNKSKSGNGVVLVKDADDAREVFPFVKRYSDLVLAQEFVEKREFRLVCFDGKVYFGYERKPFVVEGDGRTSIAEFIEQKNRNLTGNKKIASDDLRILHNLKVNGLRLDSVLPQNTKVILFNNSNLKCGGCWRDVSAEVHPQYLKIAVDCARSIGLRVAGIDLFAEAIDEFDPEYKVIEVNSRPGYEYIKDCPSMTDQFFNDVIRTIATEFLQNCHSRRDSDRKSWIPDKGTRG